MIAAYHGRMTSASSIQDALTDGVRKTAANFGVTFPYLTTPIAGNFNPTAPAGTVYP